MARLDLDAARAARDAARAEAKAEAPELVFGGQVFPLPVELPFSVAEALLAQDAHTAMAELLGEKAGRTFFGLRPTQDDLEALLTGIGELYGASPGESPASRSSSRNGSSRPRQISSVNTA